MRNLGLIVALWLAALLPTNSLALGLGEIEVNTFLNQPLNAEIEVISARPGEIDDLLVSLASRVKLSPVPDWLARVIFLNCVSRSRKVRKVMKQS